MANEMIGAMGVVARRAVDVCGEGDAAVSGEAGAVAVDSRGKNAQAGQIGKYASALNGAVRAGWTN
jgi:hypothetical protein